MRFLRTNTAVIVTVGPFLDKTDGVTLETALTITNERITLTADTDAGSAPTLILDNVTGATSGTANDLNYITNNDAGLMQLELAAADTNRLGRMFLTITDAANHVPVFHEFMVLPAMIYDAFILGTDVLDASVTQIAGSAVSTSTAQLGVNAVNVGGTAQTGRDLGASVLLSSGTGTGQLDFTSGVVKANLAQILGTALTETAGLIAAGFKKFFNVATPTGTVNSLPDAVAGAAGGVFIAGTNAATTVTTALTTTFTGNLTGSVGSVTGAVGSVTGAVGSVTGLTASDVGAIKTKTDFLPSVVAGGAGGVFIAGSNAATSITTALTANVTGNLSGSVGSVTGAVGSVTGNVGGNVTGSVGSVVGAVGSVTGAVGSVTGDVGGNVTGSVGSVTGAVGSVAAGGITAASIATDAVDADALAADALAEIKTQVVAALNTDTYAEPGQGAPAATTTLVGKIGYLYKAWRNRSTQTASQYSLYNDDATTVGQKATFSDDATTADRGEIGTGA